MRLPCVHVGTRTNLVQKKGRFSVCSAQGVIGLKEQELVKVLETSQSNVNIEYHTNKLTVSVVFSTGSMS